MKKRSDEKTDEKMTGGDAASVREHVLSPEEYLSQIEFLDDDFEFQHKDGFEHVDTNFASQSYWKEAIARFKKNKGAMFSFVCILFLIVMALVGPHMNQFTYDQQIITNQNMAPRVPGLENMGILDGSETIRTSTGSKEINYYESNDLTDTYYWFGSDSLGRDLWTRTWSGTRISLYVAVLAVFIDPAFGLTDGLVSGYFGGKVDMIMQRIVEILNSIPYLITVTLLLLVMKPGLMSITFALMFSGWLGMSRIARAEVLKLKEQEYVLASRTLGAKFPHYFQRDFTKYFWSSDYTDDVLDPACDLYRGILSLYWPGCAGADGFAGFPDFEWISELYKPSVHDRVPVNCHGTSDAVL